VLIDEIEEFSRISKANQYSQFINEFCKTGLGVENNWLKIDFIFDDQAVVGLNPEITFKDKCRKFMNIFEIRNLSDNIKIKFRCIGKLPTDKNIYELTLQKNEVKIRINNEEKNGNCFEYMPC